MALLPQPTECSPVIVLNPAECHIQYIQARGWVRLPAGFMKLGDI
jgi:hypothetical protein